MKYDDESVKVWSINELSKYSKIFRYFYMCIQSAQYNQHLTIINLRQCIQGCTSNIFFSNNEKCMDILIGLFFCKCTDIMKL